MLVSSVVHPQPQGFVTTLFEAYKQLVLRRRQLRQEVGLVRKAVRTQDLWALLRAPSHFSLCLYFTPRRGREAGTDTPLCRWHE